MGVGVIRHPGATVLSVLTDLVGGRSHGVPPGLREALRRTLPGTDAADMAALLASANGWLPESLALLQTLETVTMATVLEELDGLRPDVVAEEIEAGFSGDPPPAWRAVAARPAAFMTSYRRLVAAVWDGIAPLWTQADGLHARETERVGVAAVSGALEGVMDGLRTRVRFDAGRLHLPNCLPNCLPWRPVAPGRRRLVLVPLASGLTAGMYSVEREDAIWVAYPLPGLGQILDPRRAGAGGPAAAATVPDDALVLLLGPVRAAILRHAGTAPSVSDLAGRLGVGASTVTYHCDQLVRAGLLERARRGREVRLRRTGRGAGLIDLLS
ncbi:winged helix-turn-helix domain-containing protein [Actinomadura graeca]|uniref:winged helix-turn-helix domain-containing protein n=1 Tax=Actinomadura graeca TaxID=2750812 RepID=UPI001E461CBC|nr:winged helix-turn-helix domain-containing protein [Actinomadura graeca]